ncbi:alkaline shock response membrane anchor protein AmaP [Sulfoacidibacillus ferrooxidans]|uniref:Alkaline shock response membrane anchor protein AmaP n=1 Tax=Sulfoacidibacillus ferrooxidans TaxID=2005001 RepID=A0A9X2ABU4_9BACL|nr:hypothetical protein [Sulfoacidibacillus ferrooxidans]
MTLFDRMLLRLFSLLVLVNVCWTVLGVLGVPFVDNSSLSSGSSVIALWVDLGLMIVLSVRFLLYRLARRRPPSFVKDAGTGEIRIGYETVKEIAHRAAKQVRGVERLQTKISADQEGLVVLMDVRSLPAVDVTAMSEQIQELVMTAVRNYTSLAVSKVHVHIVAIAPEAVAK